MHLLPSDLDDSYLSTLIGPTHRQHLRSKQITGRACAPIAPPDLLTAKVTSLMRYLKSLAAYYTEELATHEYGDHPHADQDRARIRTVERIRAEIVRLEIAPAAWLEDPATPARPCPVGAPDICHGKEIAQ